MKKKIYLFIFFLLINSICISAEYKPYVEELLRWMKNNRNPHNCLPFSHVGDERLTEWTITYDSAVAALAYISTEKIDDAKKIMDFYIETPDVWRLGGIIEAFIASSPINGKDWSIRTGANLWMGIANFHLYKKTGEQKYLDLAKKIAELASTLQNLNKKELSFGGISLGPKGNPNFPGDQHLGYDKNNLSFTEIYSAEINIDAYSLFNMLYMETKDKRYGNIRDKILTFLKSAIYNKDLHRFNRGVVNNNADSTVATDVHSWCISALGVETLNLFEPGLAEKILNFIENNCVTKVDFKKPSGKKIKIIGADFIEQKNARKLKREPLASPEWTFQLINAYTRVENYFTKNNEPNKAEKYRIRKKELIENMLKLAVKTKSGLGYPYATMPNAVIGHEYNTPAEGNLSLIGAAYGILALKGYEPLFYEF